MPSSAASEMILHADDIVARRTDETLLAVVDRTHDDVDTHGPIPAKSVIGRILRDKDIAKKDFRRFLKDGIPPKGTVVVQWQNDIRPELIRVSKLKLIDRSLLPGDVVKRDARDAMSGVIVNTKTKCTLQPICDLALHEKYHLKGLLPPHGADIPFVRCLPEGTPPPLVDIPLHELELVGPQQEEDLVTYQDWLGHANGMTCAITLRLADNGVVEILDDDAEHVDRALEYFQIGDVATTKKATLRLGKWIYGKYNPETPPVGTVVDTRVVTADFLWTSRKEGVRIPGEHYAMEPPSTLERDELESSRFRYYDPTRRPAGFADAEGSTLTNTELHVRLTGMRVRFVDLPAACAKYDGSTEHGKLTRIDRKDTLGYDLNVFEVHSFTTSTTVQWQDQTVTEERGIDLIPDTMIDDEHVVWPGEIVHSVELSPVADEEGLKRPAKVGVVQTVHPEQRMAKVKWSTSACIEYMEDEDRDNAKTLVTGVVGVADGEEELVSLYEVEAPGQLNVRRGDVVIIMKNGQPDAPLGQYREDIDWVGEIIDTSLDGTLTVRLGAAADVRDVRLKREEVAVAIRSDGTDPISEWVHDNMSDVLDDEGPFDMDGEFYDGYGAHQYGEDYYAPGHGDDDDYDSDDDDDWTDEEEPVATYEDENGQPLDEDEVENPDWESDYGDAEGNDIEMADAPTHPISESTTHPLQATTSLNGLDDKTSQEPPEAYAVLDGDPPRSHHFVHHPPSDNPNHMKRTQKEHKILRSSGALPKGVYVRTWESRLDLLRVLIVGPEETPYSDAPFVFDFYLPSSFPTEPPQAYFHSWPAEGGLGGVGRANPNLYEDGKICLSLLGTWEGSKGEGWSALRSTLLQVIVSILGLVLVREPYFNEAGYEPLAGLENYKRPSALYSERIFLRSKSFVLSALHRANTEGGPSGGCEGLDDIIRWLYKDATGPRLLRRVIDGVEEVLQKGEDGGEPDGMTVLSVGACIPLRRVLERLRERE